jgi:UDP-GlcNAc:undecaprenyl-phosphate GlcNAc-1-phosphate transferase
MPSSFPVAVPAIGVIAFVAAAAATAIVRAVARRLGAVAQPRADRWHARPTATLGGIGIFLAAVSAILAFTPLTRDRWVILGASSALFVLGLIDDYLEFKPYQKLVGQLIAASVVIYYGLILPWTSSALLNIAITFLWLIGITNAVNLLDNMDGLATGVSSVAAIFLAINFYQNGQLWETSALAAFAGALLGFLVYNHNPASIFMSNCGSMFIGFFLASAALLSGTGGGRSRSVVAVLAVPVLVLLVPIFDTTFVAVMRKLAGRSMMKGGRDHTSHRLVALGLSEKHAVWLLYALAITAGTLGLFARHIALDLSVAAIGTFVILLTFVGVHLARVRVYDEEELAAAREKPLVSFLFDLSYKRRIFEVLLDVVLVSLAYYFAYALKFGPFTNSPDWALFLRTLPIVVCLKIVTFLAVGVYRGLWRYASVSDVFAFARAVALSSVAALLAIVFAFRFAGFSRTVFILDGLLLLIMLTISRFSFRILRRLLPMNGKTQGKRVLIYGAGDGGELVSRELHNNAGLQVLPVGFIDDDPAKIGRLIHGLRVYAQRAGLAELCRKLQVEEIILSTDTIRGDRLTMLVGECATVGVVVSRAYMGFQRLSPIDFGWVLSRDDAAAAPLIVAQGDKALLHASASQQPAAHN